MANALLWPRARFEWDDAKDLLNQRKHGVGFSEAQHAFVDPSRVVLRTFRTARSKPVSCAWGAANEAC